MHARVVLGVGKGVLFREVSSVQECPHRERGSTVYMYSTCVLTSMVCVCDFKKNLNSSLVLFNSARAFSLARLISLYCSACCRDDASCVSRPSALVLADSSCRLRVLILSLNSAPASCSRLTTLS